MSSFLTLTDAIEALFPPGMNLYFDGAKPSEDEHGRHAEDQLPWVVVNIRLPAALDRSTAGTAQGERVHIITTIAGLNTESVHAVYDRLYPALEGSRPVAHGWRTSPLRAFNTRPVEIDRDLTFIRSNAMARFALIEWEMTVSRGGVP